MQDVLDWANAQERLRGTRARVFTGVAAVDMQLHTAFRQHWPSTPLQRLRADSLKNDQAWAALLAEFTGRIPDLPLMSVLKLNVGGFGASNFVLVTRLVWLAVEVTRHVEQGGTCMDQ